MTLGGIAGERIRTLRQERGWGVEALALATGYSISYISMIERAERRLHLDRLERFAVALEVHPLVLLRGDGVAQQRVLDCEERLRQIAALAGRE